MASAEFLVSGIDGQARALTVTAEGEGPVGLQLVGSDPDRLKRAASLAVGLGFDTVELNGSCPARRIRSRGRGSALMKDPDHLGECARAVVEGASLPVSVKLRLGESPDAMNYIECAHVAVDAGAAMIALHCRTARDSFNGPARWSEVKQLVDGIDVPVAGSGDLWTAADCCRMLDETGCAMVLVARGAMGNPWIFSEAAALLAGRPQPCPTPSDVAAVLRRHFAAFEARLGEYAACRMIRRLGEGCLRRVGSPPALAEALKSVETQSEFESLCATIESAAVPCAGGR